MFNEREIYVMQYPCLTRSAEDTLPSLIEALEDELGALKELQRRGGWVGAVDRGDGCSGCEVYDYTLCTTDPDVASECGMESDKEADQMLHAAAMLDDLDLDPAVAGFPERPPVVIPVAG